MAQECGFFNAQLVGEEYDRVYLAEQFAAYFASFIGNGVFGRSMQQLEVVAQATPDMSVRVLSGQGWINGWWYRNTEEYTLNLDVADGVLNRIDVIVLRWGNAERDMWLDVIKGTPSSNPVAPSIKRDADYYDLQLATISIVKGTIRITQANITDTRLNNSVCGLVTGVVDQIDTTNLYNQFSQYFQEFKEHYEADYANWTAEKKSAYNVFVANQEMLYRTFVEAKQGEYNTWTADMMTQFIEWASASRTNYETWIGSQEQEYLDWVAAQEGQYETWVALKTTDYEDWTDDQKAAYETWIAENQLAFREWYQTHTTTWSTEFDEWFETIRGKMSGDIAASLQQQINDLTDTINSLYSALYSGWFKMQLVSSDGFYLKSSDNVKIFAAQPMGNSLLALIKTQGEAIASIMDMLGENKLNTPAVSSNSGSYIGGSDGSVVMFTGPLCKCKEKEEN